MDTGRHTRVPPSRVLAQINSDAYPDDMAETSDIRRIRVDLDLWKAYEAVVGNGGRSADIKAYIEWRVDNPTTPLPGKRRGPVKKVRRSSTEPASD